MNRKVFMSVASCAILLATVTSVASAAILDDLANAIIIEDFQFGDPVGTAIEAAVNSANPGNLFDEDADNANVLTNGFGQLDASGKNNIGFGTNFVDVDNASTGRYFGVMELTWDFDTTIFDPAQDEEIRITLTNNDPRGTEVLAQVEIQRTGLTDININGVASPTSDGATEIADFALNISQTAKFIAVVDVNLDTDKYFIHFSDDGGSSFTTTGTGDLAPTRILNAVRFALNEDFSDDSLLVDRLYLAQAIPEPSSMVLAALCLIGVVSSPRRRSPALGVN